jgi:hypothetical protein
MFRSLGSTLNIPLSYVITTKSHTIYISSNNISVSEKGSGGVREYIMLIIATYLLGASIVVT